jgi:hypothetical protein
VVGYDAMRVVGLVAMGVLPFLDRTLVMKEAEGAAGRKEMASKEEDSEMMEERVTVGLAPGKRAMACEGGGVNYDGGNVGGWACSRQEGHGWQGARWWV